MKQKNKKIFLFFKVVALVCCNIIFINQSFSRGLAQAHKNLKSDVENQKNLLDVLIKKSLDLDQKAQEIEAESSIEWLGFIPGYSPWETQLNTSFEKLWSDSNSNMNDVSYQAINLVSKVQQRTPYGLSLDLSFEKLFDIPDVNTFLFKERVSGNIYISLLNDFLGFNTQEILNATDQKNKKVFDNKKLLQACQKISNQFFETFLQEKNLKILSESVDDLNFIQSRLSLNTITQQNNLSLKIDKSQLLNRVTKSIQSFKMSQLNLSDLLRLKAIELENLSLNENIDLILKDQSQKFQIIDQLNLEIEILDARKKLLQLNQKNDISIYAGLRSFETLPLNDTTNSNVVGLNFNWNFSNIQIENSKKSLEFEIIRRKIQRDHVLSQQKEIQLTFQKAIEDQVQSLKNMKEAETFADDLQQISIKNFLNGRIGFFEFLTTRNQINSVKTDYNQALVDFYKIILDQSVYLGDVNSACFLNLPDQKIESGVSQNSNDSFKTSNQVSSANRKFEVNR